MNAVSLLKRSLTLILVTMAPVLAGMAACSGLATPVEASIVVDPASGGAGTEITVTGEGFPAGVEINIRLGPPEMGASPEAYATATTAESGRFVTAFALPDMWPDGTAILQENLLIIALIPDGSVRATAPLAYQPSLFPTPELTLDPPNGEPGQRVVVTGAHFQPGAAIVVRVTAPEAASDQRNLALVVSDSEGAFRTAITIPKMWPRTGAWVQEQKLMVEAVRPSDGASLSEAVFLNVAGEQPSQ